MEVLISSSNDIYTTNFNVTSKTLTISGMNNFPTDVSCLKEVYDVTAGGAIGLPNSNQFAWFRSNDLPIFVWGLTNLPAGAANSDTLNILIDIAQNQSILSLQQKQATASAGSPGTYVGGETPTGALNGTNKAFTTANTPIKGAITLIYTATGQPTQFLQYGIDFTTSGANITTVVAPIAGTLYAVYYH